MHSKAYQRCSSLISWCWYCLPVMESIATRWFSGLVATRKTVRPEPAQKFSELPRVTVQLPIFNEQFVIDRLLQAVCRLDYPRKNWTYESRRISTDETVAVARELVEHYAAQGYPITYHHRINREGFKAGTVAEGMKARRASLSPSSTPISSRPPDFLNRTVHISRIQSIGMVQTRWTHIDRNYSALTEVEAILLDGHFVMEHPGARAAAGSSTSTDRRDVAPHAIEDAGGWQHDPRRKTPILAIARNSRDGNSFTARRRLPV